MRAPSGENAGFHPQSTTTGTSCLKPRVTTTGSAKRGSLAVLLWAASAARIPVSIQPRAHRASEAASPVRGRLRWARRPGRRGSVFGSCQRQTTGSRPYAETEKSPTTRATAALTAGHLAARRAMVRIMWFPLLPRSLADRGAESAPQLRSSIFTEKGGYCNEASCGLLRLVKREPKLVEGRILRTQRRRSLTEGAQAAGGASRLSSTLERRPLAS